MGAYEKSTDVNQIAAVYEKYRENPENAYRVCSMGIIYRDPEDSYYDEAEFAIVKGNTVLGNLMADVRFYGELALVREGIEKIHEALPDYKYIPMRDVREAMYPEKMTTEQLALCIETITCTGIRISEIKYFTVERVKSGKIEIYNKGKYRRIFLPKVLQKKLLSYCQNNQKTEGWIFVTKNGKLKDRSNIWREMKKLKEKAGVAESKIFPHNFRHLFARIYYKVTKDITGLADLLGHSGI